MLEPIQCEALRGRVMAAAQAAALNMRPAGA